MYQNYTIIAVIPAGRRVYLEIFSEYLLELRPISYNEEDSIHIEKIINIDNNHFNELL